MEEKTSPDAYGWSSLEDKEPSAAVLAPYTQRGGGTKDQAGPRDDPYAKASFALGVQPPEDWRGTRRLVMKRKVLRRRPDGGVEVSDESASSEPEPDAEVWNLQQKMLQLRADPEDSISEGELETSSGSDESPGHSPCFLLGDFGSRSFPTSQSTTGLERPKSFIPPRFEPSRRGKTDPVAKYLEYKEKWKKFPIPGEEPWQELRWGIREQMLYQPEPPVKARHPHVLNTYAVPTEKKRAALRWEVRWDLAKGLLPRKATSACLPRTKSISF